MAVGTWTATLVGETQNVELLIESPTKGGGIVVVDRGEIIAVVALMFCFSVVFACGRAHNRFTESV